MVTKPERSGPSASAQTVGGSVGAVQSPKGKFRKYLGIFAALCVGVVGGLFIFGVTSSDAGVDATLAAAPGPETTGVPEGIELAPSGSVEVKEQGAVIDGLNVTGRIYVRANDVMISNTRIDARGQLYGVQIARGVTGLTIIDSEIFGARSASVSYGAYRAYRLDVHGSRDGLLVSSDVAIQDSWIHDIAKHGEGLKSIGGSNVSLIGNHVVVEAGSSIGAALEIRADRRDVSTWQIRDNVFAGGRTTIRFDARRYQFSDVDVEGNIWMDGDWGVGPTSVSSDVTLANWDDNLTSSGEKISAPAEVVGGEVEVAVPAAPIDRAAPPAALPEAAGQPPENSDESTLEIVVDEQAAIEEAAAPEPVSEENSPDAETVDSELPDEEQPNDEPSDGNDSQPKEAAAESNPSQSKPAAPEAAKPEVKQPAVKAPEVKQPAAKAPEAKAEVKRPTPTTAASATTARPKEPEASVVPKRETVAAAEPRITSQSLGPCTAGNPNAASDDPNRPDNGSSGRYRVSTNSIPPGYPNARTTGFCGAGMTQDKLQRASGQTITRDGTVIDGQDIRGSITIAANNVTIKRSRIESAGRYPLHVQSGYRNILIEDTRILGVGGEVSTAVYLQSPATLRRVHITGGSDNLKASAGATIERSYLTGVYKRTNKDHNDVVQIRNGSGYYFRGNTMVGPWQTPTSVILLQAKAGAGGGPISNVTIEDNYFSGGGYTIYTIAPDYPMTNAVVRNNRFEANSWRFGWRDNRGGATYSGNVQVPS